MLSAGGLDVVAPVGGCAAGGSAIARASSGSSDALALKRSNGTKPRRPSGSAAAIPRALPRAQPWFATKEVPSNTSGGILDRNGPLLVKFLRNSLTACLPAP